MSGGGAWQEAKTDVPGCYEVGSEEDEGGLIDEARSLVVLGKHREHALDVVPGAADVDTDA